MPRLNKLLLCVASILLSGANGDQVASSEVAVSVTIPVNLPLVVPANTSFKQAAEEFCQRNNLDISNAEGLEKALEKRWEVMQQENRIVNQCTEWQLSYNVFPNKDWGTMPREIREIWLKDDCDAFVPSVPPEALYTLKVDAGGSTLDLHAFDGDTVSQSVERFCKTHGIDFAQFGETLINGLIEMIKAGKFNPVKEKRLLFSVPFNINERMARLPVHEGDDIDELVSNFCQEYGIKLEDYGTVIKNAIIETSNAVKKQLENEIAREKAEVEQTQKQEQQQEQQQEQPQGRLLLDIPVTIDGEQVSMKLYDGDFVNEKIDQFCSAYGLDKSTEGPRLLEHIKERTSALQNQ